MSGATAPIDVLVIGCGAAFENLYLKPLLRLVGEGSIRMKGLVDPSEARLAWGRGKFSGAQTFQDLKQALAQIRPTLTIVISPPGFHAAQALEALRAGSHVFCEKPLADTPAAGRQIVEGQRETGLLVGVDMARRFHPNSAVVRDWVRSGKLGTVRRYEYREGSIYTWPVVSEGAFKRSVTGGGVLQDKGVHILDFLEWVFGAGTLVTSRDDSWAGGVEANVVMNLKHGPVEGLLQLSWDQDLNNGFWVQGSTGELYMPIGPIDFFLTRQPGQSWQRQPALAPWPTGALAADPERETPKTAYAGIELQIIHMVRAILHGEPVPVPPAEALQTLELISQAYERATPLEQPWRSTEEQTLGAGRHWRATQK